MTERDVTIGIKIAGLPDLDKLQAILAQVAGKTVTSAIDVQVQGAEQVAGLQSTVASAGKSMANAVSGANSVIGKTPGLMSQIGSVARDAGSMASNAFGNLMGSVENVGQSATKLLGSLSLIAAGGGVAGLSFVGAEQAKLYLEEVGKSIAANKQLRISQEEFNAAAERLHIETPGTVAEAAEQLASALVAGGAQIGRGQKALENANAVARFFYANQERLKKHGITSVEQLMLTTTMTEEELGKRFGGKYQIAVGLNEKQMKTSKSRLDAILTMGKAVDIEVEVKKRPWDAVMGNLRVLKETIGDSMATTLMPFTEKIAGLVEQISEIPGAPGLIGFVAVAAAGLGVLSLMVGLVGSIAQTLHLAAIATKLYAAAQWLLNAAMSANPLGIAIIALAALAGILYLVEQKTHFFSNAWANISKTAFIQELVGWIQSLVGWLNQGIAGLTKLGGGGALKMVFDFAGAAMVGPFGLLLKPLLLIADFLYKIFIRSDKIAKLLDIAGGIWNNIWGALSGTVDFLKKLVGELIDKIRSFLPSWAGGYTEEEKSKNALKAAGGKEGETYTGLEDLIKKGAVEEKYVGGTEGGGTVYVPQPGWEIKFNEEGIPVSGAFHMPASSPTPSPAGSSSTPGAPSAGSAPIDLRNKYDIDPDKIYTSSKGAKISGKGLLDMMSRNELLDRDLKAWGVPEKSSSGSSGGGRGGTPAGPTGGGVAPSSYTESEYHEISDMLDAAGWSSLQVGGPITKSGFAFVHRGEEVPTAGAVRGGETTLDRINRLVAGGAGRAGDTNHFDIDINVQKMDSRTDVSKMAMLLTDEVIDRLNFKNRNKLDSLGMRGVATLRGV